MDWARDSANWPLAAQSRFLMCKPHKWHVQDVGSGPLLLLIHGAGGATQSWRNLAPLLAHHFRVVMIDLPGQGFTKLGARDRCSLDAISADILKLCAGQEWKPAAIIGHSAGAAIALRMAEDLPTAPPVVGINAALGNFTGLAGVMFPLMAKALAAMPFVAEIFTASNARPKSVDRLISGTGSALTASEQRYYQRLVGDRDHVNATLLMMAQWHLDPLLKRLPRHPSKTLLITGDNDRSVPPRTSRDAAKTMPDATHIALAGLGHLAHEENAPAVAAPILEFLAKAGI